MLSFLSIKIFDSVASFYILNYQKKNSNLKIILRVFFFQKMQPSCLLIEEKLHRSQQTFLQMNSTIKQYKQLIQNLSQITEKLKNAQQQPYVVKESTDSQKHSQSQTSTKCTSSTPKSSHHPKPHDKPNIEFIRQNIIGLCTRYTSPYNIELEAVYVDHTATNRSYTPIETMISYSKRFLANPHTEYSHFGKYSTQMMHYAIKSLLQSFNADEEKYIVLPTGSGSTGAVEKAIRLIQKMQSFTEPQIFITSYEHHSNILPWVQFYGHVNNLASDQSLVLQMDKIKEQLRNVQKKNIIVSVSAASNVTSQLTDLYELNSIIKKLRCQKKKIIFAVDCAAYCCHHQLDVEELDEIDFAFISPHKNLGGAETCGLLLVKKEIISSQKPTFPGGGTVSLVKGYQREDILYNMDLFNREVAGTPPFIGFYRAALSFELLKQQIGYEFIHQRELRNSRLFLDLLMNENLKFKLEGEKTSVIVYGDCNLQHRANVFTINIVNNGDLKNHNLISEIFSDIFGLQVRSGCFCAGPLSMHLLKLDKKMVDHLMPIFQLGILKEKPGYIRMDVTFYLEQFQIQYIVKAIALTAKYCHNMAQIYTICNDGEIKRHKLYKQHFPEKYELRNFLKIGEEIKKFEESQTDRLKNRQKTLQSQLLQGEQILKDPLGYLKLQLSTHKI